MNFETAISYINEDTDDVKKFNLYKIRVRKTGRKHDIDPSMIHEYLDDLQTMFDADVYRHMKDEEIIQDIAGYFNRMNIRKSKKYKIL